MGRVVALADGPAVLRRRHKPFFSQARAARLEQNARDLVDLAAGGAARRAGAVVLETYETRTRIVSSSTRPGALPFR